MVTREEVLKLMEGEEFDQKDEVVHLGEEAIPSLLDIMKTSPDLLMRMRAIIVLGEIGSATAAPAIEAALRDPDPVQRLTAARAFSKIAGPGATVALVELVGDADPSVSQVAMESLAEVGDKTALAALERIKGESPHDFLRKQATVAIFAINKRVA